MRCRSGVIENSFASENCCKQRLYFSSQSGYMGYQERKMGARIGEPFRMGSSRLGSTVGQALPRSGLVLQLFCGLRSYVMLVIALPKRRMWAVLQHHIIFY